MSSIAFHSQSLPTVRVSGHNRALFATLSTRALLDSLGLRESFGGAYRAGHAMRIARLLKELPGYFRVGTLHGVSALVTHLSVSSDAKFDLDGQEIRAWICALNTMIANGSDPMILGARLHGQCEVHCYVEGRNRAWLAEIIDRGLAAGIYREPLGYDGWEKVAELLRAKDDEPVVTSYSVCDSFPSRGVAENARLWEPEPDDEDGDSWYDLPEAEQWSLCLQALREDAEWMSLSPDKWRWPDFYFDTAITGYHVAAAAEKAAQG